MKKIFFLFSIFLFPGLQASAVPARTIPLEVTQNDGDNLLIFLYGDESYHYFMTEDEIPVVQGEDLSYYYASVSGSNLMNSGILAHNKDQRGEEEKIFIQNNLNEAVSTIVNKCSSLSYERLELFDKSRIKRISPENDSGISYIGKKKGLVILVNFADTEMSVNNPAHTFSRMFNERGYNDNSHIGSVRDYFYDQSYGKFELSFDVIGPVTVSKELPYYGRNNAINDYTDVNVEDMVVEACKLADEYVDYSDYDWDDDGEAEQIFLIYAGYGESSGAPSYTIWPHKSIITSDPENSLILDNTIINTYACTCELAGTSGNLINGIGTACHEFSHCLGLPDLYDVNYRGGFGMDAWDLMDRGSYSGPNHCGEVPCGYSAYERWFAGWLDFNDIYEMERITDIPCIADEPTAFRIINENHPDEYFILENRQNKGWFTFTGASTDCHGLMITHVDYSPQAWILNNVNTNRSHQRLSIVPADNDYGQFFSSGSTQRYNPTEEDLTGDLFPGSHNVTEFTGNSHSNAGGKLFNESEDGSFFLNKPITNIKEINGLISLDFMGGIYVPTPSIISTVVNNANSFSVTWNSDKNTDYFIAEATEIKEKSPNEYRIITESFNTFTTAPESKDGIIDVSVLMDSFTQSPGWKGKNLHTSSSGVKIGNDKSGGYLTTPLLTVNRASMTVQLSGSLFGKIILTNEQNDTIAHNVIEVNNRSELFNFSNLNSGEYYVTITTETDSCYMSKMTIYDGNYSEEDLTLSSILGYLKPAETITIPIIYENSCTFDNLKARKYKCRVRASYDEAFSEWSDYVKIDIDNNNNLHTIQTDDASPFRIYNLSGRRVFGISVPGVYIYDYGTHKKKVFVR